MQDNSIKTGAAHQLATTNTAHSLTLTLSATQADTLEDALLTFQPHTGLVIHPASSEAPAARFAAHLSREQLPCVHQALQSYAQHIEPRGRPVASLLALLSTNGGRP